MNKDAVITVRVTRAARRRIEAAARAQGRSLSQVVERLIESGLGGGPPFAGAMSGGASPRRLGGTLAGGRVPTLADFKAVRSRLASSLGRRTGP
jgi:hypothetical protein